MNPKDENLAYLPQYYCSHGNALVVFWFCANRLGKKQQKNPSKKKKLLAYKHGKTSKLRGGLAGKMIWQMADETISVWQDKTDGVEMGPS